jgi:hypothetical protein
MPFGDFSREGLTDNDWLQVWIEDLDMHQKKLPGSPAAQNNAEHQRRRRNCQISMKKIKQAVL